MDEIAELNRIWEATEARLSALNGEQEREYEIINPDKTIAGKISIPVEANEDEILDLIMEHYSGYNPEIEYTVNGDGGEDKITLLISVFDGPDVPVIDLITKDEIEDFDEFMQNVLGIHREQYLSGRDGWITKEYTIVTGIGGPHVEFTTGYEIRVYWGGKSREFTTYDDGARATMDRIEEHLNEIYGGE